MTKFLTVLTVLFVIANPVFAEDISKEAQEAAALLPKELPEHLQVTVVQTTERGQPACPPGMVCEGDVVPAPKTIAKIAEDKEPTTVFSASTLAVLACAPHFDCSERESFWSFTNLALGALQFTAGGLDAKTTMDSVDLNGTYDVMHDGYPATLDVNFAEVSGPEQWFIDRGTGALVGYKVLLNTAVWVACHELRRSENGLNRVIGWAVPIVFSFVQFKIAVDNQNEINRINDLIGR